MSKINYLGINTPLIANSGEIKPSVEALYGPYSSLSEAHTNITDTIGNNIPVGLTVGIKTGNQIVEYWYNGGTSQSNLVLKGQAGSGATAYQSYVEGGGTKDESTFKSNLATIIDAGTLVKLESDSDVTLTVTLRENSEENLVISRAS